MKQSILCLMTVLALGACTELNMDATTTSSKTTKTEKTSKATKATAKAEKETRDNFKDFPVDPKGEVYVTKTGDKYHYKGCPSLNGHESRRVSKAKVQRAGLHVCKNCTKKRSKK
ncbi:MAG: hypothetical protein KBT09_02010 [Bacteroidales bacterium]|nr:hypothetical protein [Candidatus Sodaliphilus fimicaballi]